MVKPNFKRANPNHIFIDTNVIIGAYIGDSKHQSDESCVRYLCALNGKRLFISALSVAQLVSVFQKIKTNKEIIRIVKDIRHRFEIINFTTEDIDQSLADIGMDIEDNIQHTIAKKRACRVIVTNNNKDYRAYTDVLATNPKDIRLIPR